jgi:hypothetical protein
MSQKHTYMLSTRSVLFLVAGTVGLFALGAGLVPTMAQNMTGGGEQQLKSAIQAAPGTEAVASGNIFVVVCPPGSTDPNECQVFTTQRAGWCLHITFFNTIFLHFFSIRMTYYIVQFYSNNFKMDLYACTPILGHTPRWILCNSLNTTPEWLLFDTRESYLRHEDEHLAVYPTSYNTNYDNKEDKIELLFF